jgi:hypothetical protein
LTIKTLKQPSTDELLIAAVKIGGHRTAGQTKHYQKPFRDGTAQSGASATDVLNRKDDPRNVGNVMKLGKPMRLTISGRWMLIVNVIIIAVRKIGEIVKGAKRKYLMTRFPVGMARSAGWKIVGNWNAANSNGTFDLIRSPIVAKHLASEHF